jgi:integrase
MGIYRRRDKQKKYSGPWYMQYPQEVDPITGEVKYACEKVGFSKRMAERAFAKKMVEWEKRKHLGLEKRREYLFRELVDWYFSLPGVSRLKSAAKIRQHCESLKKAFGNAKASQIKPGDVEEYREKKLLQTHYRGTSYRPASVNREIEVMRRIYNLAMRDEMVDRNPCWKVTRLSEKNARDRVLSAEELDILLKKLPQHAADIVAVGYHTGMRAGEIFNLTWDRVNMKEGYIRLEPEDTKTKDSRHVYFNGTVREILERLGKVRHISHDHVFTYQGKPLKSIKTALAKAMEETGIKDFHLHDLRHTWTTNARKAGVDRTVIMKLTGHKTLSMFTRYNTVDEADAKQALQLMEGYFEGTMRGTTAIPLQAQKRGQEKPPNPLNSLAPRVGLEPTT